MKTIQVMAKVALILVSMFHFVGGFPFVNTHAMEAVTQKEPERITSRFVVKNMKEAVELIIEQYPQTGVAVAFDFDDTLGSKEIHLMDGKKIRYLEKSLWMDISLNKGELHPVFKTVCNQLGLNLVETFKSFKAMRGVLIDQESSLSPILLENANHKKYCSVEENEEESGCKELKHAIKRLQANGVFGAFTCIVSAATGDSISEERKDFAHRLGFLDEHFVRGAQKFNEVVKLLNERGHCKPDNDAKIHTLILIDDTPSYLDAWERHGKAASLKGHKFIAPNENQEVHIVSIHYDYWGQNYDFLVQQMIKEFLNVYGEDYKINPFIKPFLKEVDETLDEGKQDSETCTLS